MEGGGSAGVTAASLLADATSVITTGVSSAWDIITSNPLTSTFAGASILALAFRFIRKARRTAH